MNTCTIGVCMDCMMLLANGEVADDCTVEPLSEIDGNIAPGLAIDEHTCEKPLEGSCECENFGFSYDSCPGCNGLAGDRFAATLWLDEKVGVQA